MSPERRAAGEPVVADRLPGRRRLRRRTKVVFALVTVLVALPMLEGVSRLLVRCVPSARWGLHWEGLVALGFPALNEICVPDAKLFWKSRPNLDAYRVCGKFPDTPEICFTVSTDGRGLRRVPTVDPVRYRILFLGDSCTFGLGVEDDETFPVLLQSRLDGVQCINAGMLGFTAYQGRVLLEQLELDAPPDVVVITFGRNDGQPWDQLGDLEHARLIAEERSRSVNRLRFVQLVRYVLPKRGADRPAERGSGRPRLTDAEFVDNVRAVTEWCHQHGAQPILVVWPHSNQMWRDGSCSKQAAVLRLAHDDGIRCVDLVPVFRASGRKDLFLDMVHATPAGCELAADALLPVLQEVLADLADVTARP